MPAQGAYITYGGKRLMAITPGQGMIIDPTGDFSRTDNDSDVWRMLPIPSSELSEHLLISVSDAACRACWQGAV